FQAEDGIRDYKVTGVQTCALPILKFQLMCGGTPITNAVARLGYALVTNGNPGSVDEATSTSAADSGNTFRYVPTGQQYIFNLSRSEERRVGKECRSRRWRVA